MDDGPGGLEAADDELVRLVGDLNRAGNRASCTVRGDLGVALQGDGPGKGRATVEADGADPARHPELQSRRVGRVRGGRPQRESRRATAVNVGILEARAGDGDGVRVDTRPDDVELAAVGDEDGAVAELRRGRNHQASRAGGGDRVVLRADGHRAGVARVGAGPGDGALGARARLIGVDEDRAGADQGSRDGEAGGCRDHAHRGGRGDGDHGVAEGAGRGLEDALVDIRRAGVGVGAGEGELARAGLGQADVTDDRTAEETGGVARRDVGLVEVDRQGRQVRARVLDRSGVGAAAGETHQRLVVSVEVEGADPGGCEVEDRVVRQAVVGAQVGEALVLTDGDAEGGTATREDHVTVALAGDQATGHVELAAELEGIGQ